MAPIATAPSISERLRAKYNEALKEERMTELQLDDLQKKRKKLRRRHEALSKKSAAKKVEKDDAFLAFARNECLEFCNKVYKAFPREIRDTIHGYITDCEDVYIDDEYFSAESETELRLGSSEPKVDHWWKPEFVGTEMVREIGENYYRSVCFHFEEEFNNMTKFRATDQFGFGFLPVYFVSNVEVEIECDDYQFGDDGDTSRNGGDPLTDLLLLLEYLMGFRPGTAITISLVWSPSKNTTTLGRQEWMAQYAVPVIFPVLQRLKDTNCRARVVLDANEQDDSASFASQWDPTSLETIMADFREHVDGEHKRKLQAELDAESDEDFGAGGGQVVSNAWDYDGGGETLHDILWGVDAHNSGTS